MNFFKNKTERLGLYTGVNLNLFGIEQIAFEHGKRGTLLWFITGKTVYMTGLYGFEEGRKLVFEHWYNDHTSMG